MQNYRSSPSINENDLAIIERTDYASQAISKGAYVYWNGKLRTAKDEILQGAELSASLFDDVDSDGGALNEISALITQTKNSMLKFRVSNSLENHVFYRIGDIVFLVPVNQYTTNGSSTKTIPSGYRPCRGQNLQVVNGSGSASVSGSTWTINGYICVTGVWRTDDT